MRDFHAEALAELPPCPLTPQELDQLRRDAISEWIAAGKVRCIKGTPGEPGAMYQKVAP